MTQFIARDSAGVIQFAVDRPDGMRPMPHDGFVYHLWEEPLVLTGSTPTSMLCWIDDTPAWVETASIEELRAVRRQAINVWKLEANNTYFEFAGEQIAYRDSDRIEIQAVHNWVTLTGTMPTWPDWPAAWKAISNRWVPVPDVATWMAFTLAIAERGTAHFKRAQQLKAALATAATPAEIEAITW